MLLDLGFFMFSTCLKAFQLHYVHKLVANCVCLLAGDVSLATLSYYHCHIVSNLIW